MFTGIIEQQGKVISNQRNEIAGHLIISSTFNELKVGESIAVNGVCLTLLPTQTGHLEFDVSPETLRVTSLGQLQCGDFVNLERAMKADARFGGHYVSGHVDTQACVQSIQSLGDYVEIELEGFSPSAMLHLIPKGSITVEGVSLTINSVKHQTVQLMLVPHTLLATTLGLLKPGSQVNIEFDYLTRIVAHQLKIFRKLSDEVVI